MIDSRNLFTVRHRCKQVWMTDKNHGMNIVHFCANMSKGTGYNYFILQL